MHPNASASAVSDVRREAQGVVENFAYFLRALDELFRDLMAEHQNGIEGRTQEEVCKAHPAGKDGAPGAEAPLARLGQISKGREARGRREGRLFTASSSQPRVHNVKGASSQPRVHSLVFTT